MRRSFAHLLIALPVLVVFVLCVISPTKAAAIDLQGTAYFDQGITNLPDNKTISLSINGGAPTSVETDTNGAYSFTGLTLVDNDVLTLYLDGETEKGVNLIKISVGTGDGTITHNIYKNYLILSTVGSDPFTVTDYNIANDFGSPDVALFFGDGVDLVVANAKTLYIADNTTFQMSGNIFASGDIKISSSGAIDAASSSIYIEKNLDAQGNLTASDVHFTGVSGDQFISQAGTFDSNIVINKASDDGQLIFNSNINLGGKDLNFAANGGVDCNRYNLVLQNLNIATGIFNCAGGNITANGTITTGAADAIFDAGSGVLQVGSIVITDGQFTASADTTIISDTFRIDGGSFNHNGGQIILEGANNTITTNTAVASVTFNNLKKVEADDDTSSTITVKDGLNVNIVGVLTLDGFDGNDRINLRSTSGTDRFDITMSGPDAVFGALDYLDIQRSRIIDSGSPINIPVNPASSIDSGQTYGWFPRAISGTGYSDAGITPLGPGINITLTANGTPIGSDVTDGSGHYTIPNAVFAADSIIMIYIAGGVEKANTIYKSAYDNLEQDLQLDLYQNYLILDSSPTQTIDVANLQLVHTGTSETLYDQDFNTNGFSLTGNLNIKSNTTLSLNVVGSVSGNALITGTLATASNNIAFKQDLTVNGAIQQDTSGTVILDGTVVQTINSSSAFPNHLRLANNTAAINYASNIQVTNDLYIAGTGTTDCSGYNTQANAIYLSDGGVFTCATGEVTVTQAIDILGSASTFTMGSGALNAGSLALHEGTMVLSSNTTTISNTITLESAATLNNNSGTVNLTGTANIINGSITFNNLSKTDATDDADSTITFKSGDIITILGQLSLVGIDSNDRINITTDAEAATLFSLSDGASLGTLDYLNIRNADIVSFDTDVVPPLNPTHSSNAGATHGWFGVTLVAGADVSELDFAGTFVVQAGGTNNTGGDITINYQFTNSSTATPGVDFDDSVTSVVIPNGQDSAIITIPLYMDNIAESTETIVLAITSATDYDFNASAESTLNLLDHVNIVITPLQVQTTEGSTSDVYSISLTRQPTDNVVIDITPDSGSSVDINQITFTNLSWDPVNITVNAVDDGLYVGDRDSGIAHAVNQGLTADTRYAELTTLASVTNHIIEDELAPTDIPTNTPTASATLTPTLTNTPTPTLTATPTTVPTATPTRTPTPSPTQVFVHYPTTAVTPFPTITGTPQAATTGTITPTITGTITITVTPTSTTEITEDKDDSGNNGDNTPTPTPLLDQNLPETGNPLLNINLIIFLIILIASSALGGYLISKHYN